MTITVKNLDTGKAHSIDAIETFNQASGLTPFPSEAPTSTSQRILTYFRNKLPSQNITRTMTFTKGEAYENACEDANAKVPKQQNRVNAIVETIKRRASIHAPKLPSPKAHGKTSRWVLSLTETKEIIGHNDAIWVAESSISQRFVATAGQSGQIKIWEIQSDIQQAVIKQTPIQVYNDHSRDVVQLAWSSKDYLYSASLDKTVRMWHPKQETCISCFQHARGVLSIAAHPELPVFLSGSCDKKLRLWDTNLRRVCNWSHLGKVITATTFSPSGEIVVVGVSEGEVYFFHTNGLKYYTEITCRNRRGRYKNGAKVVGLTYLSNGEKLLVSTNDARIRLYCSTSFTMIAKFKGQSNNIPLMRTHVSSDEAFIVSGSENGFVYMWKADPKTIASHHTTSLLKPIKTNVAFERFTASESDLASISSALFLPLQRHHTDGSTRTVLSVGFDGRIKEFMIVVDPSPIEIEIK